MHLRLYQERGRTDIYTTWRTDDIVFFVLATGGGKTVIFVEVIRDTILAGKRVMLLVHRDELIDQAHKTLYRNKILGGIIQGSTKINYDLPVQVCSIQTLARRTNLPPADVIIIDEGHHTTETNSYGRILQQYPNAKVLIVSATPYRLSGEGFKNIIPGKETKLVINSTLRDLIDDGWLVPIRMFVAGVPDLSGYRLSQGDYKEEDALKAMELAPVVESYRKHAPGKSCLTFAVNVKHSIDLVSQYWQQGIPAEHVDANTPPEIRARIISDYNCGLAKVVSNVGIFTEGTDFERCEVVQLARPTKSLSLYCQMVGRGTRPEPGLVDLFTTSAARREAIALSTKPDLILLDNAGMFREHFLPDYPHDWARYFAGTRRRKGEKVEELEMEMLVYEAEDEAGNRVRTTNVKEVDGLQLVEITKESKRKLINIKSIKEFERLYQLYGSQHTCKRPGTKAVEEYVKFCEKHGLLMVPEVWEYMEVHLVDKTRQRLEELDRRRSASPDAYPDFIYQQSREKIAASAVTRQWILEQQDKYSKRNQSQLLEYTYSHK